MIPFNHPVRDEAISRDPAPDPGCCSTVVSGGTHVGQPGHRSPPFLLPSAHSLPGTTYMSRSGKVATLDRPLAPESHHRHQGTLADKAWRLYVALGGLATLAYLLAGRTPGKRAYFTLIGLSS